MPDIDIYIKDERAAKYLRSSSCDSVRERLERALQEATVYMLPGAAMDDVVVRYIGAAASPNASDVAIRAEARVTTDREDKEGDWQAALAAAFTELWIWFENTVFGYAIRVSCYAKVTPAAFGELKRPVAIEE